MTNREFRIGIGATLAASLLTAGLVVFGAVNNDERPIRPVVSVEERSTAALLKMRRTKAVSRELLNRPNVDPETLRAAMIRLSTLSDEAHIETFHGLVESLGHDSPEALLKNLPTLALFIAEDHEDQLQQRLKNFTANEHHQRTRQVAYASRIAVAGSAGQLFGATKDESLLELIKSLPLVDHFSIEDDLYSCIQAFIVDHNESNAELQAASIASALKMPHAHEALAADLVNLARQPECSPAVASALARLPAAAIPEAYLGHTAAQLIARIAELQSADNFTDEIDQLVKQCMAISARLPSKKRKRIKDRLQQLLSTE